ncbi:MAG: hypothetical protein Q8N59_00830 [bacterium]|nr:hypothetical protein [bacterium]
MEKLEFLKVFLKEHSDQSSHSFEEDETACNAVEQFANAFLVGNNGNAEEVLCNCLGDSRVSIRFLALCALLKARKLGRELQTKTLQGLEKIEKSKNYHDLVVLRTVEKKFRAESQM